ncbi:helix-turn-helix domain-containing protein [Alkalicoccus urumqiensis]|uniref:helix-turn-helix domain-containing protein n=1 Tax=Alkalicoccus urumqiensis TaxID=1548213 RepID=UPI0015E5BAE0|nr:RodZ family helix-turn-helix domain-containing protein [Alkalicoccus urumqiensis]
MSELGTRLQNARQEKGYSLDELQQATKIQRRYLEAIEAGDFSKMPGEFYSRAFVKSYAEAVGLDPNQLFEEHADELPKPKPSETENLPPRTARSKPADGGARRRSGGASLLPTALAIIFVIAIGFAVWLFQQGNEASPEPGQGSDGNNVVVDSGDEPEENSEDTGADAEETEQVEENEPEDPAEEPANEEEPAPEDENEEEQEQQLAFTNESGNEFTYTLSGAEAFDVEMSFSGDSWLQILNGSGEELHQQTHVSGDEVSFDFSGENEVVFNMGSTATATIYVNGEELEYASDATRQYVIIQQENS